MKPRSPLRRISAKQLAKRGGKVFSTIATRGKIMPNKRRAAKRLARTHGPKVFREFTKEQPCAACGRLFASENAHVLGNGGIGRKKDWTTVAPLCGPVAGTIGCHRMFDEYRAAFNGFFPTFDPHRAVDEHQAAYRAFLGAEDE